jgi:hypothetical protein
MEVDEALSHQLMNPFAIGERSSFTIERSERVSRLT